MTGLEAATTFFSAVGTIATAVMCGLTWKSLQASQKQFDAVNADNVVAHLAWHGEFVLFVLENTGTLPANEITVEFPSWFSEALDKLNNGNFVKPMVDKLRNNKRQLLGHSSIPFLLCKNKTAFYEAMHTHESVRIILKWKNVNEKCRDNTQDLDLVDEIILVPDPLEKIASELHDGFNTGIMAQIKNNPCKSSF